jgi:hypothetical protein
MDSGGPIRQILRTKMQARTAREDGLAAAIRLRDHLDQPATRAQVGIRLAVHLGAVHPGAVRLEVTPRVDTLQGATRREARPQAGIPPAAEGGTPTAEGLRAAEATPAAEATLGAARRAVAAIRAAAHHRAAAPPVAGIPSRSRIG